ncbi:hypothetical protein RCO27_08260 [Sphingosinicella sp. LHD-64]|uniref:hypothetical protein n=1 Tax=Sphingosinicella sp. LHD-64 TaxID=3072139 RepID=UPI00280EE796|nr:hypothetical protein [Sphingosinicella sp. LHD-64]MDQ8756224.1 hypothetical protein [Sphingosinicella sp. LHD-64]
MALEIRDRQLFGGFIRELTFPFRPLLEQVSANDSFPHMHARRLTGQRSSSEKKIACAEHEGVVILQLRAVATLSDQGLYGLTPIFTTGLRALIPASSCDEARARRLSVQRISPAAFSAFSITA